MEDHPASEPPAALHQLGPLLSVADQVQLQR